MKRVPRLHDEIANLGSTLSDLKRARDKEVKSLMSALDKMSAKIHKAQCGRGRVHAKVAGNVRHDKTCAFPAQCSPAHTHDVSHLFRVNVSEPRLVHTQYGRGTIEHWSPETGIGRIRLSFGTAYMRLFIISPRNINALSTTHPATGQIARLHQRLSIRDAQIRRMRESARAASDRLQVVEEERNEFRIQWEMVTRSLIQNTSSTTRQRARIDRLVKEIKEKDDAMRAYRAAFEDQIRKAREQISMSKQLGASPTVDSKVVSTLRAQVKRKNHTIRSLRLQNRSLEQHIIALQKLIQQGGATTAASVSQ